MADGRDGRDGQNDIPFPITRGKSVDGFIVTGPARRYFASKKCKEGFKVKIEFI